MSGEDPDENFWVSVGARYAGPTDSRGSLAVLSLCIGVGQFGGGQQWIIHPPEVVFSEQYMQALASGAVSREEAERHGLPPGAVALQAATWLNAHAYGRPPIMLCADGIAAGHVRRFFRAYDYDVFPGDGQAKILSEQWSGTLRNNMEEPFYRQGSASDIAEAQFLTLLRLLATGGMF